MANASDYLEKAILDHVFKVAAFTQPPSIYIGLHTSSPADDDSGTEVSGTDYARVDASSSWAAASSPGGTITTNADITFPAAGSGGWGTVTHIGIYDSDTGGSNNLLFHGALAASKTVAESDIFQITSGNLTITLA